MIDVNAVRAAVLKHRSILGGPTVVHLNPSDLAALQPAERQMLTAGGGVTLESDPQVGPGGYEIGKV